MSALRAWAGAALALLLSVPAAAAPRERLDQFDVSRAESWADALAICDLTAFLRTRPSLNADVVLAPNSGSGLRPLYGPRFVPPTLFFDRSTRLSFERLERVGEADRRSFAQARGRYDGPMLRSYGRADLAELAFLDEQGLLCAAFAADISARYPAP